MNGALLSIIVRGRKIIGTVYKPPLYPPKSCHVSGNTVASNFGIFVRAEGRRYRLFGDPRQTEKYVIDENHRRSIPRALRHC